jgi:hypothetical protein
MQYKGYLIEEDTAGWATALEKFLIFSDDGEVYVASGSNINECKVLIDEILGETHENQIMKHHNKTEFELLLFERLHTKALMKIIEVKNKQISDLQAQLRFKIELGPEPEIETSIKEINRQKYVASLEARLKYYKVRYNNLLKK